MVNYNRILVEVDEILNYLPQEDLLKIPVEVKNAIKGNKDKEYFWKYDETKSLKDQNLSRDTIAFLAYLNMEYLLNNEQKELMKQMHEINERLCQASKNSQQFDITEILKNKNEVAKEEVTAKEKNMEMQEYKENFFIKILKGVKHFFSRK